eukprot:CAMPEP_0174731302 /NCGR_PEP_ID=MMETSP1094-20130205/57265_1 /TAXON_ID=156173 /ORGANISM="Chrysochromulina brevifilum, Strain UTEX LB 985" /LENGTH=313 /DNA_ID=CAMNT_0015933665 /DNA_START=16 /DNA_END=957 /DNA_ORIENTATION=-
MSAFDLPKSPSVPNSFGGSSSRFGRLPAARLTFSTKDLYSDKSPGPGSYSPQDVLGFDHSNLSGVTRSWSRIQTPMDGRYSTGSLHGTAPLRGHASGKQDRPSELVNLPPSLGLQPSSRKPNTAAYSMGISRRDIGGDVVKRAQTPSAHDYVQPSVANPRGVLIGTDDRFGDRLSNSSTTKRYSHTPSPQQYTPLDSWKTTVTSTTASSYPFGLRPELKVKERSPGPHAPGSPSISKLAVLPSVPSYSTGLKRSTSMNHHNVETPGVGKYDARQLYWSNKRALGRSASNVALRPAPTRPARDINLHKDVQAAQ